MSLVPVKTRQWGVVPLTGKSQTGRHYFFDAKSGQFERLTPVNFVTKVVPKSVARVPAWVAGNRPERWDWDLGVAAWSAPSWGWDWSAWSW